MEMASEAAPHSAPSSPSSMPSSRDGAADDGKAQSKTADSSVSQAPVRIRTNFVATPLFLGKLDVDSSGRITIPWAL